MYIASKQGNVECVKLLLANRANPKYHYNGTFNCIDVAANAKIEFLLEKAMLVSLTLIQQIVTYMPALCTTARETEDLVGRRSKVLQSWE